MTSADGPQPPVWDRRAAVVAVFLAPTMAWSAPRPPKAHVMRIADMAFPTPPPDLRTGDVIEWINVDGFRHTATARNGDFDLDLPKGRRGRTSLKRSGSLEVYCRYHPAMRCRLVVRD